MDPIKDELHLKLRASRAAITSRLEGVSEYDLRRPLTPTGTNLLGLVKHLAGVEYVYLGESFGRPATERLSWVDDGSVWDAADMWVTATESSTYIRELYDRACAHGDQTIAQLDLSAAGSVPHWAPERRNTTLGVLLIRMVDETARHAGHIDILREMIDGYAGPDNGDFRDADGWRTYVATVQAAADAFAPITPATSDAAESS